MPDPTQSTGPNADKAAAFVFKSFRSAGYSEATAAKNASLAREMYNFIDKDERVKTALEMYKFGKDGKEIYEGTTKAVAVAGYVARGGSIVSTSKMYSYGAGGGAQVLGVFVDRFASYAQSQSLELNECSLGLARVSLDIATAGAGAVTSLSGIGAVVAGFAVISTFQDSYSLGKACFGN